MTNAQLKVLRDAHPRGISPYRHWLSRTWASNGAVALVIGINPNTATDTDDDGMTRFLVRLLSGLDGEFACGGYILVNCCDLRGREPKDLQKAQIPCSSTNLNTIQELLTKCSFVVASWGTADYGPEVANLRDQVSAIVRRSGKKAICFSPRGLPIFCSQTNKNSRGRWSTLPVPWTGA